MTAAEIAKLNITVCLSCGRKLRRKKGEGRTMCEGCELRLMRTNAVAALRQRHPLKKT